jgi:hypothetical protein
MQINISLKELEALEMVIRIAYDSKICYVDEEEDDPNVRNRIKEALKISNNFTYKSRLNLEAEN